MQRSNRAGQSYRFFRHQLDAEHANSSRANSVAKRRTRINSGQRSTVVSIDRAATQWESSEIKPLGSAHAHAGSTVSSSQVFQIFRDGLFHARSN
jgi:hypothetical protein